jgi:hypothetical protein
MIEKLNEHDVVDPKTGKVIGKIGCDLREIMDKLNELVDAVNELQATISKMEKVERSENVQTDTETRSENVHAVCPAVKYMGKVCRFWNGDNGKKFKNIGVLIEILSADNKRRYTCASKPKKHFEFCEPVKPDDNIIYKGDDNE